ncbi:hypothetical protein Q9L58_000430 [Maublancomyces gigas]|uniref:Uncharacterized protein n=1 Tax=Discina gigas TaxID=1032678 RepID=A0ABR3GWX3_9PEZI
MDPAIVNSTNFGEFYSPDWKPSSYSPKFLAKPLVYTPTTRSQVVISVSETNWVYLLDADTGVVVKKRQVRRKLLYMCFFPDLGRLTRTFNCQRRSMGRRTCRAQISKGPPGSQGLR